MKVQITITVDVECELVEHPMGAKYGTTWVPTWDSNAIEDAVCKACEAEVRALAADADVGVAS